MSVGIFLLCHYFFMLTQFLARFTRKTWKSCCSVMIRAVTSGVSQLPADDCFHCCNAAGTRGAHLLTSINYTTVWGRRWSNSLCCPRLRLNQPKCECLEHLHHRRTRALLGAYSRSYRAAPALQHSYLTRNWEASPEKGKPKRHPNGTVQRSLI